MFQISVFQNFNFVFLSGAKDLCILLSCRDAASAANFALKL